MIDLLKKLVQMKGSDLHLMAGLHPAFRINGKIVPQPGFERLTPQSAKELIYSVLNDFQKHVFEKDDQSRGDLDFALGVSGLGRFRFNVLRQRGTIAASVRALAGRIPDLNELGLPPLVGR